VIKDVIFLPGTQSSQIRAVLRLYMMPNMSLTGSVHSHPSSNTTPSGADLALFARTGSYHIIVGAPYTMGSWKCYDALGHSRVLDVLDIQFDEDEDIDLL
jgi:proteasome lid subunit RPN8/RPN11